MMKRKVSRLARAAKAVQKADKVLNVFIGIVIIIALLYGAFGLWDAYQVYNGASVDSEVLKYKPQGDGDENLSLSELQKINPDVCAWLTIDGTKIDYPVVQGESNMEYINKAVDGTNSLSGSVFLDYRNKNDFSEFYSLLYAHHMSGEVMFGVLPKYQENDFFDKHKTGILYLPDMTYEIEIFACVYTDAYDNIVFSPNGRTTPESKQELLDYIKDQAVQYDDLGLTQEDQIIGMSTCYDASTNGRILVFGKLTNQLENQ